MHTLLRIVLLCLVMATLAQAGHVHLDRTTPNHAQCDLCVGVGGLATPPANPVALPGAYAAPLLRIDAADIFTQAWVTGLPPARGPPTSC